MDLLALQRSPVFSAPLPPTAAPRPAVEAFRSALTAAIESRASGDAAQHGGARGFGVEPAPRDLVRVGLAAVPAAWALGGARADRIDPDRPAADPAEHSRQMEAASRRLVVQVLLAPLMAQLRHSPFKSELFSGGRDGEAFAGLYHQHLADRMGRAAGDKLVRRIVHQLERRSAPNLGPTPSAQRPESGRGEASHPWSNVRIHVAPGF